MQRNSRNKHRKTKMFDNRLLWYMCKQRYAIQLNDFYFTCFTFLVSFPFFFFVIDPYFLIQITDLPTFNYFYIYANVWIVVTGSLSFEKHVHIKHTIGNRNCMDSEMTEKSTRNCLTSMVLHFYIAQLSVRQEVTVIQMNVIYDDT